MKKKIIRAKINSYNDWIKIIVSNDAGIQKEINISVDYLLRITNRYGVAVVKFEKFIKGEE